MFIYRLKSKTTGKSYIGSSKTEPYKRKSQHKTCALITQETSPICVAIRKYGWDDFEWSVLWEGDCTKDEMYEKEQRFIDQYDSFHNGYNSTPNGKAGGSRIRRWREDVTVVHDVTGEVLTGLPSELRHSVGGHIYSLINGIVKQTKGWRLVHP